MLGGTSNRKGKTTEDRDLQRAIDFTNKYHETNTKLQGITQRWDSTQKDREALASFETSNPEYAEKINKILSDPIKSQALSKLRVFFQSKETQSTLRSFEHLAEDEAVQSLIKEFKEFSQGEKEVEEIQRLGKLTQNADIQESALKVKELLDGGMSVFQDLNNCKQKFEQTVAQDQAKRRDKLDVQNKSLEDWMKSQDPFSPEEEKTIEEANQALRAIPNTYLANPMHFEMAAVVKADGQPLLSERVATYLTMQRMPSIQGRWEFEYIEKGEQYERADVTEQRENVLALFEREMPAAFKTYYNTFVSRIGGIRKEVEGQTQARDEMLQSIQLNEKYNKLAEAMKPLEKIKKECQAAQKELPREIDTAKQALLKANECEGQEAQAVALKKLQQLQEKRDKLNQQVESNERELSLLKIDRDAVLSNMTPEERKHKIKKENEEKKWK